MSNSQENLLKMAKYILYFCNNSKQKLYKTKLNKLLFYLQFLYYKTYQEKLLDNRFIKDHYGPVLKELDSYINMLEKAQIIECIHNSYGDYITPKIKLPNNAYEGKEERVLNIVNTKFKDYSAKEISDYSHDENLWCSTPLKDYIDLARADELNDF